jgi:Protein of unknown function (DUF559)
VRDFYWPHCRLVVEADSYRWHRSPSALNDDRERDVELTLAGYRVLRFTYEQVTRRPRYVIRALRYATLPPAARTCSSARSPSPGWASIARTAVESTVAPKPSRSASSAVSFTQ